MTNPTLILAIRRSMRVVLADRFFDQFPDRPWYERWSAVRNRMRKFVPFLR